MKKKYKYQISIKSLDPQEEGRPVEKPVTFETQNHDNVFAVIRRTRKRLEFDDVTATSFALGLKLMTEVLLENRNDPLFSDLKPAMVAFMRKLKTQLKSPLQPQFSSGEKEDPKHSDKTLGIKESVERSIQEIEQKNIAFAEIEVSSIEEMDDDLMAEFESSIMSSYTSDEKDVSSVLDEEVEKSFSSTMSNDFSLSSHLKDTEFTLVERIGEDGALEEIELLEVEEDQQPQK